MFDWFMGLFKRSETVKEGHLHDFRSTYWGHSIIFGGKGKRKNSFEAHGWVTPHLSAGDIFLHHAKKGLAIFYVLEVDNKRNVPDMFFATVGIIRYATEADIARVTTETKTGSVKINLDQEV
jgi:hypothetical protein